MGGGELEGPLKKVELSEGSLHGVVSLVNLGGLNFLGCLPSPYRASLLCSTWGRKT